MRLKTAALLASAWLASSGAAWAQVDAGNEVTVNPLAAGSGVLLYPGGQYMRTVPPLLQPGQSAKDNAPIHLHMPGKHSAKIAQAPAAAVAEAQPKRTPRPKPAPKQIAAAPAAPAATGGYEDYGPSAGAAALGGALATGATPARPAQVAKAEPPAAAPPAQEAPTPGLTKRSVILFAPQASDPAEKALGAIKFLAGDLNAATASPSSRIELYAYGGPRGDKSSDSHRLSLKRALAIRQVLIDDGVPSERIDVHAPGGADDSGPADRVDVYIKA